MNVYDLILAREGKRLRAYRDTRGHLTIGIGRNLDANGISDEEAQIMFHNDVDKCVEELESNLPWFGTLDAPREGVLIDMCFEIGIAGLLKFTDTLAAIERHDWPAAAAHMLDSEWAREVPKRADEDAQIMLTGLWPGEGGVV